MKTLSPIRPYHHAPTAAYWAAGAFIVLAPMMLLIFLQLVPPSVWDFVSNDWRDLSFTGGARLLEQSWLPPEGSGGWLTSPGGYLSLLWPFLVQPRFGLPVTLHLFVALAIAATLASEIFGLVRDQGSRAILAEHISGPQPFWGNAAKVHLAKYWKDDLRRTGRGVELAPDLIIPRQRETEGFLLAGRPGSGKSVILEGLMAQALTRGARVVALDVKGRLAERLKGFEPNVLGLSSKDRVVWNIGRDLVDEADADEFAACLIPESRDPVWSEGSRLVLSAIVQSLQGRHDKDWGWIQLNQCLSLPVEKLEPIIFDYAPSIAELLGAREDPPSFVVSLVFNLASHVSATASRFADMEKKGSERLSLRDWAKSTDRRQKPLIMQYDFQRRDRSAALMRLTLRVLSGALLGAETPDGIDSDTWIFLDELTRIGPSKSVEDLASLGRSRGVRTVVTVQSPAQLVDVYGAAGAEALRENFATQIVCAMPQGDNAQRVSRDWIGDRIVEEPDYQVKADQKPQTWTLPALSREEIAGELGLKYDLWGRPLIRAAVVTDGNVAVLDWPLSRWKRLR